MLGVIAMLVDWKRPDPPMIDPSDFAKIQTGDVVRLSELLKEPAGKVCLLTPYQDRLEEAEPLNCPFFAAAGLGERTMNPHDVLGSTQTLEKNDE